MKITRPGHTPPPSETPSIEPHPPQQIKKCYREIVDLPPFVEAQTIGELYQLKWRCFSGSDAYWFLNDLIQIKKDKEAQIHTLELIKNTQTITELRAENQLLKLAIEELVQHMREAHETRG